MPYIAEENRELIDNGTFPTNEGDLNYFITTISLEYLNTHGESYKTYNDIFGALSMLLSDSKEDTLLLMKEGMENKIQLGATLAQVIRRYKHAKGNTLDGDIEARGVVFLNSLEIYRRKVSKYESEKMLENGDVF